MTVQEIGRLLNRNGFNKASTKRINFKTVNIGHYELKQFKYKNILAYIHVLNNSNYESMMNVLSLNGLNVEYDRGYIKILKND